MWRCFQSSKPNVLTEISVRIVLYLIVSIMHLNLYPHTQYITEREFLHEYRRPRKDTTTPMWAVLLLLICVPLLIIIAVPFIIEQDYSDTTQALLAWSLGCGINAFLTETGKLMVGRPRPDFFYRCFPNGKMTNDLRCTNTNLKDVIEGRKSFPSGHSSFSFCSLGFCSVWMCGKLGVLSRSRGHSIRILACFLPLVIASYMSLSRYCDHHHHWEDLFVGAVIGCTSCYFCYRQYYYPLNSLYSGMPYELMTEGDLFKATSEQACSTNDLEVSMAAVNRNMKPTNENNKKAI